MTSVDEFRVLVDSAGGIEAAAESNALTSDQIPEAVWDLWAVIQNAQIAIEEEQERLREAVSKVQDLLM